ncbi:hypothetical protein [Jiella endophytica]|nr:hypothetical protein [Jiella endophytica]
MRRDKLPRPGRAAMRERLRRLRIPARLPIVKSIGPKIGTDFLESTMR